MEKKCHTCSTKLLSGGPSRCSPCQIKHLTSKRQRRQQLTAKSLCSNCGRTRVSKGGGWCVPCRQRRRWQQYGLDGKAIDRYLIEQAGLCKICQAFITIETAHVDHCHKTNRVRGLLCRSCNVGLGHFKDKGDVLARAARYITSGEIVQPGAS